MEDPVKAQQPSSAATAIGANSKLRYPLRSSTTKLKVDRSPTANSVSDHKRGRSTLTVSKSVNFASLSANEKSARPPRRLSIPTKRAVSPRTKSSTKNTPVSESENRARSVISLGKSDTPIYDVSKSSTRRKFNVLSSSSYWLSQIKLSESVPNHALSFGFFKLAHEAGCEPLQLIRDELKSYILKHNITKPEPTVKELLELYAISETFDQVQASESTSRVPEEANPPSFDVIQGPNSPAGAKKLKSKPRTTGPPHVSSTKEPSSKSDASKASNASRLQGLANKKPVSPKMAMENGARKGKRRTDKARNQLTSNGQVKIKQENKEDSSKALETKESVHENKENVV